MVFSFKKLLNTLFFSAFLLMPFGVSHLCASDDEQPATVISPEQEQALEELINGIDINEIEKIATEIDQSQKQDEQAKIQNKNKILWSIPAAFPEDEFDEHVKDMHVNVPFYGKISVKKVYEDLKEEAEKDYAPAFSAYNGLSDICDKSKNAFTGGMAEGEAIDLSQMFTDAMPNNGLGEGVGERMKQFAQQANDGKSKLKDNVSRFNHPGMEFKEYLTGRRLTGIGLYRSDLNEIAFLAANAGTDYLLFKDLKKLKLAKATAQMIEHREVIIGLIEQLKESANDRKKLAEVKKKISTFIGDHCALFKYNPLKKELFLPIAKYIALQRLIEQVRPEERTRALGSRSNDDHLAGFVEKDGKLVKSGVVPI